MTRFYLQIPHSDPQAAHAIISHGDIAPTPERRAVPLGSVQWTLAYATVFGVSIPNPETYPDALRSFLLRDVRRGTFAQARPREFVKPVVCKQFVAGIRGEMYSDLIDDDCPAYICDPVTFVAEWRMYVCNGRILGAGQYGEGDDADAPVEWAQTVADCWTSQPAGWSLDVGRLDDGRLALVEVNDGWALGFYKGCPARAYMDTITARWHELTHVKERA